MMITIEWDTTVASSTIYRINLELLSLNYCQTKVWSEFRNIFNISLDPDCYISYNFTYH
jgi:hypothetical protein